MQKTEKVSQIKGRLKRRPVKICLKSNLKPQQGLIGKHGLYG